ncbi:MAG: molybdopterin molybdotransferase MoeA [Propionibacteriaceae bacterium]|nr:molybdopterin molybdotransferase MoeA [Propionibacteriaceae bacterium]
MKPQTQAGRAARSVDAHLAAVLALAPPAPAVETVPLAEAAERVLAAAVTAPWPLPRFANAAMDGYALRWADLAAAPGGLPVDGRTLAGEAGAPLAPGSARRVMTGAPVPAGADTVVPLEDAVLADSRVLAPRAAPGRHLRLPGEDVAAGAVVLAPGVRLGPRHLGAAAAAGVSEVTVAVRPRVAVLATGTELAAPGEPLGPAGVTDSNGPYLAAAVPALGGVVVAQERVVDEAAAVLAALDRAAATADLIVVAGGASAGDKDLAAELLGGAGAEFVTVAMQPGKPQGAGCWRGVPVLSFPGNPVSVAVSAAVFLRPLLDAWLGATPPASRWAAVSAGWTSPGGKRQFMPVSVTEAEGGPTVRPASPGGSGSHLVTSLARADALAIVPEDVAEVAVGQRLELLELL